MLAGRARRKKMRDRKAAGGDIGIGMANRNAAPTPPPPPKRRTVSFGDDPFPQTEMCDDDDFKDDIKEPNNKDKKKRKKGSHRSSHLTDVSSKEKSLENDEALKTELARLESTDSQWSHPVGFGLLSALRILNAPLDPVLSNTGYWIQPEDLDDIPAMFDSYLNLNCLYYSLVGVLAIETSLFLPIAPPDSPEYAQWMLTVSRFCMCANGVWSLAAVVASFHMLWAIYATPTWAKRRFCFDNSRTISLVYALGAPNFALLLTGTITGVLGNIFIQEGFTNKDWISAIMGLCLGVTVALVFVMCSGSLISKAIRPWKIADENLNDQKRRWSESTGRSVRRFLSVRGKLGESFNESLDLDDDRDDDFQIYDVDEAGFGSLEMPLIAQKLCGAGFTMEMLRRVNNELLLNKMLEGAEIDKAGHRLKVILFIRDERLSNNKVEMTSIGSGVLPIEDDSSPDFRKFKELTATYPSVTPSDDESDTW